MVTTFSLNVGSSGAAVTSDKWNSNVSYLATNMLAKAVTGLTEYNILSNTALNATSNAILKASWGSLGDAEAVLGYVFDACDDSSIDANKWTTSGSVSETTIILRCTGVGYFISNGASGLDFNSFAGNSECLMRLFLGNVGGGGNYGILKISDGSSEVTLIAGNSDTVNGQVNLIFNKAGEEVRVFEDGVEKGSSPFDLSGLSTNWYLKIEVTGGNENAKLYYAAYLDESAGTGVITTDAVTLDTTCDTGLMDIKITAGSTTDEDDADLVYSLAADGSNFSTVSRRLMGAIANSGTSGKLKITYTLPTTLSTTVINMKEWDISYGAYFG